MKTLRTALMATLSLASSTPAFAETSHTAERCLDDSAYVGDTLSEPFENRGRTCRRVGLAYYSERTCYDPNQRITRVEPSERVDWTAELRCES